MKKEKKTTTSLLTPKAIIIHFESYKTWVWTNEISKACNERNGKEKKMMCVTSSIYCIEGFKDRIYMKEVVEEEKNKINKNKKWTENQQ